MTETIEKWMQSHAADFSGAEYTQDIFISGLKKGIEIAEGFAEFCMENFIAVRIAKGHEFIFIKPGEPQHKFTTSQLLEIYLKTLEP